MSELSNTDYEKILAFYKKPIPSSKRLLKRNAEKILTSKLCRCIKKVSNSNENNEGRAIGICSRAVVNSKGYSVSKFKCKRKHTIKLKKNKKFKSKNQTQKNN